MSESRCAVGIQPDQCQALLEVSESIAEHRDLTVLFRQLAERLPRIIRFDSLWLVLHDPAANCMRLHLLAGVGPAAPEEIEFPLLRPMEEAPSALVWSTQEPLVVPDLASDGRYPKVFQLLLDNHIRCCAILPLTTAHRRLGAVGFGYQQTDACGDSDVEFLGQVTRQVAVAVDNALAHQEAQMLQAELEGERDRLRLLLDLNNTLAPILDLRDLLRAVSWNVRRVMRCDYASAILPGPDGETLRIYARALDQEHASLAEELVVPWKGTPSGNVLDTGKPLVLGSEELARLDPSINPTFAGAEIRMSPAVDRVREGHRNLESGTLPGTGLHSGRCGFSATGGQPGSHRGRERAGLLPGRRSASAAGR